MYINQKDAQNSCDYTLFSITSHLVYAGVCDVQLIKLLLMMD